MSLAAENLIVGLNWHDFGGTGEPIVMVHGLGGSLANWQAVGPLFARSQRAVALDLPGFGLSSPRADFSLATHAEAVVDFAKELGGPVTLMGNSMGGLVCEMVAAEHPELVTELVLVSPATPPRLPDDRIHWPTQARLLAEAVPGVGMALGGLVRRRYTPEEIVDLSLRLITHDPSRVPPEVVASFVDLARVRIDFPWAVTALTRTANSIATLYRRPRHFVEMIRRIQAPTLIVHGVDDEIVSPGWVEWLHSLRSDWDLIQMEDTGHTPQLDAPVRFFKEVQPWLSRSSAPVGSGSRVRHRH